MSRRDATPEPDEAGTFALTDAAFVDAMVAALPGLLRLAERLVGSSCDAEEAVQDALERGWSRRGQLQHPENAEPWLRRILANAVCDGHRRPTVATSPIDVDDPRLVDLDGDPVSVLRAAHDERQLRAALRHLPPDELIAVVLHTETQDTATQTSTAVTATSRPVSRRQAISIARKRYPGSRSSKAERDDEDGRQVWKVKLKTAGGAERKVSIAISNGTILKTETATATTTATATAAIDRPAALVMRRPPVA